MTGLMVEARMSLNHAFTVMNTTGESILEAELLRLKGELLIQSEGSPSEPLCKEAEGNFQAPQ